MTGVRATAAPSALGREEEAAIVRTCIEMAWAIDERRWEDLGQLFTDPVHIDYTALFGGEPAAVTPGHMATVSARLLGGLAGTQHLVGAHLVDGAGDEATCRSMVQATHFLPNANGAPTWTVGARYHMGLRRDGDRWRISSIRIEVAWTEGNREVLRLGKGAAGGPTDNRPSP